MPISSCRLGRRLGRGVAGVGGGAWLGLSGASRRGRGGVHTGAGFRSQRCQVLAEKLYRTRSPRALLRSWPVDGGQSQALATGCQGANPQMHTPCAHLQTQPAAPAETGRHRQPQHEQKRRDPQHSRCATSQPPGSPTGAGHRHVPGSQAHSGMVPGAGGKGTQRQSKRERKRRRGKGRQRQEGDRPTDRGRKGHRDNQRGREVEETDQEKKRKTQREK